MTSKPVIETLKNITDVKLMRDIFGNMNYSDVDNLIHMLNYTDDQTRHNWYEVIKITF